MDGSDPATEWHGVLSIDETPNLLNPATRLALQHEQLAVVGGRARTARRRRTIRRTSIAASRRARAASTRCACSTSKKDFTLDSLIAAAYDSYLPAFDVLMPRLLKAYDAAPASNPLKAKLAEQIKRAARLGLPLVR